MSEQNCERSSEIPPEVREKAKRIEAAGGTARIYRCKHGTWAAMDTTKIGEWQRTRRDERFKEAQAIETE